MPRTPLLRAPWLPWALLPLAVVGMSALWLLVALHTERQSTWMAVIGALDALWVLGFAHALTPHRRALLASLATLAIILLTNWSLAATYAGGQVGLSPVEAVVRLGFSHARTLAGLANGWQDAVWLLLAFAVAAGGPFLSARLRATSAR